MVPIKLRGHHIHTIENFKNGSRSGYGNKFFQTVYGQEMADRIYEFIDGVYDNTLIEIVEGNDTICDDLKCPYSSHCRKGDYATTADLIIEKILQSTDEEIIERSKSEIRGYNEFKIPGHMESEDAESLKKFNAEVGKKYTYGELLKDYRIPVQAES